MRLKPPPSFFQLIEDENGVDIVFRAARVTVDDAGAAVHIIWDIPTSELPNLIAQAGELLGATEKKKRAKRPKLSVIKQNE